MRWNDSQMSQDIFHHFSILQAMNGPEAGTSFDFLHNLQWFITRLSSYSQRKWYTLCSDNPIFASVIVLVWVISIYIQWSVPFHKFVPQKTSIEMSFTGSPDFILSTIWISPERGYVSYGPFGHSSKSCYASSCQHPAAPYVLRWRTMKNHWKTIHDVCTWYIYICIYIVYTYIYIYTYIYVYIYMYIYSIYIYIYIYTYIYVYIYMYIYILYICVYIYIYVYIYEGFGSQRAHRTLLPITLAGTPVFR